MLGLCSFSKASCSSDAVATSEEVAAFTSDFPVPVLGLMLGLVLRLILGCRQGDLMAG